MGWVREYSQMSDNIRTIDEHQAHFEISDMKGGSSPKGS